MEGNGVESKARKTCYFSKEMLRDNLGYVPASRDITRLAEIMEDYDPEGRKSHELAREYHEE